MRDCQAEKLCHDPIHGYIALSASLGKGDTAELDLIDHPWVQRMRQIHQLQTAWWVYPSAEHTRFQHILGAMHLASKAVHQLYPSLAEVCPDVPSRGYVESLLRLAGLLHDVGHGPFGHFFDTHFLQEYGLTHESLGQVIIRDELGDIITKIRRNPNSELLNDEQLDPEQVAWLIRRPNQSEDALQPKWLVFLRSLLSGIYTIDNLDFVLRDAYMSGYSQQAYDLNRLLHYSFFSEHGLTIHDRGIASLVRFITVRADLFRTIYFHRTVRGIDLALADLFRDSKPHLFPGNPLENLSAYQGFTEFSLLVDVSRWKANDNSGVRELGQRWEKLLRREIPWIMVCERIREFEHHETESTSIFTDPDFVERKIREKLPPETKSVEMRVDIPRHMYRPGTHVASSGQNYLFDNARQMTRPLDASALFRGLPTSHRICRVYTKNGEYGAEIATAVDSLIGGASDDDLTNM